MSDGWTWKGAGAPWTLEAPHGVWAVSELRPGGRAELRYASFDEEGRLPIAPLTIGEFASAGDARLAADLYEAAEPPELPEDLVGAFLPGAMVVAQVRIDFPYDSRRDSLAVRVGGEGFACFRKILAGSVMPVCAA